MSICIYKGIAEGLPSVYSYPTARARAREHTPARQTARGYIDLFVIVNEVACERRAASSPRAVVYRLQSRLRSFSTVPAIYALFVSIPRFSCAHTLYVCLRTKKKKRSSGIYRVHILERNSARALARSSQATTRRGVRELAADRRDDGVLGERQRKAWILWCCIYGGR